MYVLLNGSFGVGKSHVARELRRSLPDSAIADPEWIGFLHALKGPAYRD